MYIVVPRKKYKEAQIKIQQRRRGNKIQKITWLPHIHTHKHRKGERKEQMGKIKINRKMVDLNPTISLIKWNVNWLSTPIKRQRLWDWGKKQQLLYAVYRRATLNINIHVES